MAGGSPQAVGGAPHSCGPPAIQHRPPVRRCGGLPAPPVWPTVHSRASAPTQLIKLYGGGAVSRPAELERAAAGRQAMHTAAYLETNSARYKGFISSSLHLRYIFHLRYKWFISSLPPATRFKKDNQYVRTKSSRQQTYTTEIRSAGKPRARIMCM